MTTGPGSYLGASIRRREDPRLLTGRGRFVADIALPKMLHVALARSPFAHARIANIDAAAARAASGVVAVVTAADLAGRVEPIRGEARYPGFRSPDWPILAGDTVRYQGEPIAAVVATSPYVAADAAALVDVEFDPLPVVVDPEAALAADAPLVFPEWGDNLFLRRAGAFGDVDGAFANADVVLRGVYRTQRHTGVPLEPRGCLSQFDARDGTLTLWTSTQTPHLIRSGVAEALGFPEHRLRIVAPDVGGGFGVKASLYPEEILIPFLARLLDRPVRWIADRSEDLASSTHARDHVHAIELAARRDGTILGLKARIVVDCGAYSPWPWTASMEAGMAAGNLPGPYKIRNYQFETLSVCTNKTPLGAYRGVARPSACFSIERAVDDLARELDLDPLDVRLRNLIDEYPYTTITGLEIDSGSLVPAIHAAKKALAYDDVRAEQAAARRAGRLVGIGVANYTEQTAHGLTEFAKRMLPVTVGFEGATVRMDPQGKVWIAVGIHSHGQGLETTLAQLAADELGVPIDDIQVVYGDTQVSPYGMGTFASRSAIIGGGAMLDAARAIRRKLEQIAATVLECAPDDIEQADCAFHVRGVPTRAVTVGECARVAHFRAELIPDLGPGLDATAFFANPPGTGTFANALHSAVVEVDPATGEIAIRRYVVVDDCGTVINPTIVEGQIVGGTMQGIGGALWEHLAYDDDGQLVAGTLMDYALPKAAMAPPIEVVSLCTPSPFTPLGMKGVGEGGAIAPGACLANAVSDALAPLGVAVRATPMTPESIYRLIQDAPP
ncbi:MAG TPA: xanthine dehydrogenase family protein molybdopterin-binding subunit [Thermomicrobiales bacterium]|nr:xanthine dehydrogenase family protein molybdopterin-binding subunit [Thermomicrobiales bacterium]